MSNFTAATLGLWENHPVTPEPFVIDCSNFRFVHSLLELKGTYRSKSEENLKPEGIELVWFSMDKSCPKVYTHDPWFVGNHHLRSAFQTNLGPKRKTSPQPWRYLQWSWRTSTARRTHWMNCRPFSILCQRLLRSWHTPDMLPCVVGTSLPVKNLQDNNIHRSVNRNKLCECEGKYYLKHFLVQRLTSRGSRTLAS